LAAEFIRADLTSKFFDQYANELEEAEILTTKDDVLQLMNLKTIDTKTAFRWLKNLCFTYDVQKKVYFNDRHENPENVADRKQFIRDYFDYELFVHRWVQVPIDNAYRRLEQEVDDEGNKLMKGFVCTRMVQSYIWYFLCANTMLIVILPSFQNMYRVKTRSMEVTCLFDCRLIVVQKLSLAKMNVLSRRTCFRQNNGQVLKAKTSSAQRMMDILAC